jgi:hypothetical protein
MTWNVLVGYGDMCDNEWTEIALRLIRAMLLQLVSVLPML